MLKVNTIIIFLGTWWSWGSWLSVCVAEIGTTVAALKHKTMKQFASFVGYENEKGDRKMKLHTLKILPKYYVALVNGEKTFELRKNDRDYKVGDLITFTNTDGTPFITPHKERIVFRITYILENVSEYGLDDEYCILALKRLVIKEK